MSSEKKKFALYVKESTLDVARQWYAQDNCASMSEFIDKAILFYGGYVASEQNQDYFSKIFVSTIKSASDGAEARNGQGIY